MDAACVCGIGFSPVPDVWQRMIARVVHTLMIPSILYRSCYDAAMLGLTGEVNYLAEGPSVTRMCPD